MVKTTHIAGNNSIVRDREVTFFMSFPDNM